jgi:mxaJ protein
MSSRCLDMHRRTGALAIVLTLAAALGATLGAAAGGATPARELRVCADPNNLPFSNERGEGLENRLADLIARELGARVTYTWWAHRRGFVRNTLKAGLCDVIMSAPVGWDPVLTTRPYYRSTYVFVSRHDRHLGVRTLDDPALRRLRIGVHLVGSDYANTPPAHALARRGIVNNVVGYTLYGDYAEPNPPARLVAAVADGEVDLAVVWGPLAGYFAPRAPVQLDVVPVTPGIDPPALPMTFAIAMAVRRGETSFRDELDAVLIRRAAEIEVLLDRFGVPRVESARTEAKP